MVAKDETGVKEITHGFAARGIVMSQDSSRGFLARSTAKVVYDPNRATMFISERLAVRQKLPRLTRYADSRSPVTLRPRTNDGVDIINDDAIQKLATSQTLLQSHTNVVCRIAPRWRRQFVCNRASRALDRG